MNKRRKLTSVIIILVIVFSFIEIRIISQSDSPFFNQETNELLILVNSENPVPENYTIKTTKLSNGVYVDSRIYPDLQQMFDDMRSRGIDPFVREGFRSRKAQTEIMKNRINSFISEGYAKTEAEKIAGREVAEPGTSEHELGLAVDINAKEDSSSEEVYSWLAENAYKYGFILRYPYGKESITEIEYEPWHYRYVGKEAAAEIYKEKITLEEYLE